MGTKSIWLPVIAEEVSRDLPSSGKNSCSIYKGHSTVAEKVSKEFSTKFSRARRCISHSLVDSSFSSMIIDRPR